MLFLHRYAIEIGWPVPLLKRVMSSADIAEAMAFNRLEPFNSFKDDYRHSVLCWLIARVNGSKTAKVEDFMPCYRGDKKQSNRIDQQIREAFKIGNIG